ncbi:hypothetical protein V8C34DRAFT_313644 [Trichoderma compactum]
MFSRDFEDPLAKHILTQYPSSSSSNQFAPTSSINPAQWRALQSDVDKILNDYASSPVQDQDDTPKKSNGKPSLRQLRNFLVDSILKSMLIAGGKQPKSLTPSPIVIPGLTVEESPNQLELRSDHTAVKQACLRRDDNLCVLTGMIDDEYVKSLPPQSHGDLWSCTTECAHIIPFVLRKFNPNSSQEIGKIGPENAITLRSEAHMEFARHRIAAGPTNTEHKYRVHDLGAFTSVGRDLSNTITMTQSDPAVAMPDPDLLRLHYQVSMILQESDLGNILSSKMLTDI